MRKTRRARRMQKRHTRSGLSHATLNMISLMDIFTILVFFLLVNTTSEEVLPSTRNIHLPDSIAKQTPERSLVIAVDAERIRLQGAVIMHVAEAMSAKAVTLPALEQALQKNAGRAGQGEDGNSITIMGDRDIPYALLKKIMLTCARAGYTDLALAVNRKAEAKG